MKYTAMAVVAMFILILMNSCTESEYERAVDEELSRGVRNDSLMLGLAFGMTPQEFFSHCWELNKQGLVTDGRGNTAVHYELHELRDEAFMDFYPEFHEGKIYKLPIDVQYKGWAPWNKDLAADSLLVDVVKLLSNWYDADFMKVQHPDGYPFFVNVNCNRQIVVHPFNDHMVKVVFTDLLTELKMKE